jgi:hypothetical protein
MESRWEKELNNSGTSIFYECYNILRFLKKCKNIGKVILTKSRDNNFDLEYIEIDQYCKDIGILFEIHEYSYGWIKDDSYKEDKLNIDWCYATRFYYDKLDVLPIPSWIKSKEIKKVILVGCFEYACINDMKDVLTSQNINYKLINSLIVK